MHSKLIKDIDREKAVELVKNVFDFFDHNKDGFIEAKELKASLEQAGKTVTDQEVADMVIFF